MEKRKIYKVLLTGGPCGGKTTSINQLRQALSEKYDVYIVPELGEFMAKVGVTFEPLSQITEEYKKNFWDSQMGIQMSREDNLRFFFGDNGRDVVILCDRGLWDCFAFGPDHLRRDYLTESKQSRQQLLIDRYDLIVVMVSSAFGIPEIYGLDNNILRIENLQEAIDLEKRILDIYAGHPNMFLVDNFVKDIDIKIARICDGVNRFIDQESPLMTIRKLLIPSNETWERLLKSIPCLKKFTVSEKHNFLEPSDNNSCVKLVQRRCTDDHETTEVNWLVTKAGDSCRNKRDKITKTQYESRMNTLLSPRHWEVDKSITVFIDLRDNGVHNIWELHHVLTKTGETSILKVKRDFCYPAGVFPFDIDLEECQDVSDKTEFATEFLARKN